MDSDEFEENIGVEKYDETPFSEDAEKNRVRRITDPAEDIRRAREYLGEGHMIGRAARCVVRRTIAEDDVHADATTFMADVKRELVRMAGAAGCKVPKLNSHVAIPMRRMLCAEFPEFVRYARLSRSRCDDVLYRSDPRAYGFLDEMYGGALSQGVPNVTVLYGEAS